MNLPITAAPPVNAIISVQPLTVAVPGRDAADTTAQLANIPPGTTVQGFVINRDAQSNPIVRTNLGDYLVNSDVFIKTGSEVSFRLDTSQSIGRARIIAIDGLTPDEYVGQSSRTVTTDTIAPSNITTAQAAQTPANAGQPAQTQLEAVVLKSISIPLQNLGGEPIPASLAQLQPGQPLRVIIQSLQLPPSAIALQHLAEPAQSLNGLLPQLPTAQVATAQAAAAREQPPSASANPLPNTASGAVSVPPQNPAQVEIRSVILGNSPSTPSPLTSPADSAVAATIPANTNEVRVAVSPLVTQEILTAPQSASAPLTASNLTAQTLAAQARADLPTIQTQVSPPPTPPPVGYVPTAAVAAKNTPLPANGPTVSATVIGHEGDGATILQTPFATVKLYTPQPLPYGTTLTLQATTQETLPPTSLSFAGEEAQALATSPRTWQDLLDALTPLQTTNPQALQTIFHQIPAPNTHLASTLLFFLAAVKGGDLKEWLGAKAIDRLRQISPNITLQMGEDIAQLQQFLTPQSGTNWTGIPLPIMYQNTLQNAQLYLRHEDDKDGNKTGGAGKTGQRFIVDVELSQLGPMQLDGFVREGEAKKQLDLVIRSALNLPNDVIQGIRATFETTLQVAGLSGQAIFQQGNQHFVRPLAERTSPAGSPPNTILA